MRNEVMWGIRDAATLNQDEKALLWAIESCGTAKRTWRNMAALAGMKKSAFYAARTSLINKALILVCRKYNDVSWYTVEADAVLALPQLSASRNESVEDSAYQNEDSVSQNSHSGMPETKKNTKKNKKKNLQEQEERTTAASAPVVDSISSLQGEARDFFLCHSEPRMGTILASENGDLIFEVRTTDGFSYMLHQSGVSGPVPLPDVHTAAPVDPDPIPRDAATPSPYEMELAARRREWARMERDTETSSWDQAKRWDRAKRRHKEEMAIRERHGVVPTDEW